MTANEHPFATLIQRVRQGDPDAAAELVLQFEPEIRRRIRTWCRLHGRDLRPVFDSIDICQSIFADFFVRASAGQFDLDDPRGVIGLLTVMARHKLSARARDQRRARRDARRTVPLGSVGTEGADDQSPSRIVSARELLRVCLEHLTAEERRVAELRADGLRWVAIAAELGGTAEGRRKQHARALDRVLRELGLDGQAFVA